MGRSEWRLLNCAESWRSYCTQVCRATPAGSMSCLSRCGKSSPLRAGRRPPRHEPELDRRTWPRLVPCEQLSPHQIQRLTHGEIETQIDRALRSAGRPLPCPAGPCTVSALAPLVDSVLAQQHNHTHEQSCDILIECYFCNWLLFSKSVGKHFESFQKHTAADLPDVAHDSERDSTVVSGPWAVGGRRLRPRPSRGGWSVLRLSRPARPSWSCISADPVCRRPVWMAPRTGDTGLVEAGRGHSRVVTHQSSVHTRPWGHADSQSGCRRR